ncbi:MAG: ATP-dependent Clp protease ATP-binding subunit ClpE [candidate division WS6 bacterium OLB20]|uniref:ATP-dependent Clp protease ATP-binding subunit ClpE n=1 Tax=candidate division WS6 bacterium OLB20 TaxID=1617426 RepID=A0A136LYR1_9BACT|nr:MAG: ATP-dependent Clp protease ATP-binding subunit ClpE [candidate division WS6 bacterium OLB20]
MFLRRNRALFVDTLRLKKLSGLREQINQGNLPEEIEITEYIDHDLLNVLDDLAGTGEQDFLTLLIHEVLRYANVQKAAARLGLEKRSLLELAAKHNLASDTHIDSWLVQVLISTFQLSYDLRLNSVDEMAFFLFLMQKPLAQELKSVNVLPDEVEALGMWLKNKSDIRRYKDEFYAKRALKPVSTVNRAFTSRYSPVLVQFQRDFTAETVKGDFTYSIAREGELNQVISYLEEGDASAVLLVGQPGVGRTTLVNSLATRMVVEDVPPILRDKRLVAFDFNRAFSLAPTVEVFKSRVQNVLEETASAGNIILVLDDFDQVLNIRREIASEVVNLIVSAMDRYHLRVIAVSTPEGYNQKIKTERGLASSFKLVEVKEPSDPVAVQILMDVLPAMELRYGVRVSFDALVRLVKLSHTFAFEKVLPDKGIDLLEEVMVSARSRGLEFANEQLIEEVISAKVGVKVGAIDSRESELLVNLEEKLHQRLIGQTEAVQAVADAMRRSRAGLVSGKRPIATFLFFGPTGVGKTELSKALTAVYYGDEKLMIRLDMSEYQEETNLDRLIGKSVDGRFEGGYLTEAVRNRPYSLLLLDEIEKANPRVLDLFLQVLDEGSMTDGLGRKVDFTNTIIIATSNVGTREISELTTRGTPYEQIRKQVQPILAKYLRVEFLNRFDKVILFRPLVPLEVQKVAEIMMQKQAKTLEEKGITLTYTPQLLEELARKGYNPVYGARELRRVIQDEVENKIAKLIVAGNLDYGDRLHITSLEKIDVVRS